MPPKKKKQQSKKEKGAAGETPDGGEQAPTVPAQTEREILLQREYDQLTEELCSLKKRVEQLRQENDLLQQEAQQTRVESQEYMTYMSKRTHKRQNAIITLSDQNQKELEEIHKERDEMLAQYKEKKKELNNQLLEKETEYHRIEEEIEDLKPFKDLQAEQLSRIKDLEKEVIKMRAQHAENLQKIKSSFLHDKASFEQDSRQKVQTLAKEAHKELLKLKVDKSMGQDGIHPRILKELREVILTPLTALFNKLLEEGVIPEDWRSANVIPLHKSGSKEAIRCLFEHTEKVKVENRELRQELLHMIRRSRILREHEMELEEQHQQLLREQQYSRDLARLRTTRQHKVLRSLAYADKDADKEEPHLASK